MPVNKVILLDEAEGVRLWHTGDRIGILSFQSKANCASLKVLLGIQRALQIAATQLSGIIIWQESENFFCVGADLPYVCSQAEAGDNTSIHYYLKTFQTTALQLRYSLVPIIAAVRGYALGGGCELAMHCAQIVSTKNAHIGLVETSIGLVPSGGGCKEMILRASQSGDYQSVLARYFILIATGSMSQDAIEAKRWGYLRDSDLIINETEDLLNEAKNALSRLNYSRPAKPIIPVLGRTEQAALIAVYQAQVDKPSPHDNVIMEKLAEIISGGSQACMKMEDELLTMELDAFVELALNPLSLERIHYTLKTGKHLKN